MVSRLVTAQMIWYFDLDNMVLPPSIREELENTNELSIPSHLAIIGQCRKIVMGDLIEVVDEQRYEDIDVVISDV